MTVIETLLARNEAFARSRFSPDLKIIPRLKVMIIGCVDPRVDPVEVFGLEPGDAAVIRNVGGRAYPSTQETLALLRTVAKTNGGDLGQGWNLIVLQHTDCGINCLVHTPALLLEHFGAEPSQLESLAITNPYKAVAVDIAALKANPHIPGGFLVTGLVYDVATGRLETVSPTQLLRPETPV